MYLEPLKIFKIFYSFCGKAIFILIGLAFLTATLEGFGIMLFLPLIDSFLESDIKSNGFSFFSENLFLNLGVEPDPIIIFISILFVFSIKSGLFVGLQYYASYLRNKIALELKYYVINGLKEIKLQCVKKDSKSKIFEAYNNQIDDLMDAVDIFTQFLFTLISALLFSTVILFLSFYSAVSLFALGLLIFGIYKYLNRATRAVSVRLAEHKVSLSRWSLSIFNNFEYLKTTNQWARVSPRFGECVDGIKNAQILRDFFLSISSGLREPVGLISLGLIAYFALEGNSASTGVVGAFVVLVYRAVNSILACQRHYQGLLGKLGGIRLLRKVLRYLDLNREINGKITVSGRMGDIEFRDVTKIYEDREILSGFAGRIGPKGLTVFFGPSGSGKSTALGLLLGALKPDGGEIRLGDYPFGELDLAAWRSKLGYVDQGNSLFDCDVSEILFGSEENSNRLEMKRRFDRYLTAYPLFDFLRDSNSLKKHVSAFSGGQKQRLCVLREILRDPVVLVLDEPTSSLDAVAETAMVELLVDESRLRAIVVATHSEGLREVCDNLFLFPSDRCIS